MRTPQFIGDYLDRRFKFDERTAELAEGVAMRRVLSGRLTNERRIRITKWCDAFNSLEEIAAPHRCGCMHDCCGCLVSHRMTLTIEPHVVYGEVAVLTYVAIYNR